MREEVKILIINLLSVNKPIFLNEKEEVFTEESYAKNAGIPYQTIHTEQDLQIVHHTEAIHTENQSTPKTKPKKQ